MKSYKIYILVFCVFPLVLISLSSGQQEKEKKKNPESSTHVKEPEVSEEKKEKSDIRKRFEEDKSSVDFSSIDEGHPSLPDFLTPGTQATEVRKSYRGETKPLVVKGVPSSSSKHAEYRVHYILKKTRYIFPDQPSRSNRTLQVNLERVNASVSKSDDRIKDIWGGTLLVYKSFKPPEDAEKTGYLKLIGYRENVRKNPVSLNDGYDVDYRQKKWIKRRMPMGKYLRAEFKKDLKGVKMSELEGLKMSLNLSYEFLGGNVIVYRTEVRMVDGKLVIDFKAPKGTYDIRFPTSGDLMGVSRRWPK